MSDRYSPPQQPTFDEKVVAEIMRRIDDKYQWAEQQGFREIGFSSAHDFLAARDPEYVLLNALLAAGGQ